MRALIAVALLVLANGAFAQVLYKWVDKDGRVHFSDKPPVGFKGEVTKIIPDVAPDPAPAVTPTPAPKKAKPEAEDDEKAVDIATQRRQLREQLAARVTAARAKLEAARKAMSDGEDATDDERQYVRQEFPRNERSPDKTPPPRSNCMSQKTSDGKAVWNCPRPIPTDGYFSRQEKLEEAVKKAEEELADAERAYRRGVD